MSVISKFPEIERPSLDERRALRGTSGERPDRRIAPPASETYIVEMERRLAAAKAHPERLISWDEALAARSKA